MTMIETSRLKLRPFQKTDIDFLDDLHSDPDVMRFILGRVRSHDENISYLEHLLKLEKEYGIGQRLVIRKDDNQPVGRCGISFFFGIVENDMPSYYFDPKIQKNLPEANRVYELGYTFLKTAWGKGYASEAATAMRDYALKQQKLPEVHSLIMQENNGSIKVAEKIGAVRMGACLCIGNPAWDYVSRV